jgi:formylglycine-generating enzyme required for sulfatase activity
VTLTKPFYLGRYEVTQAQWQARTGSNPSSFVPPTFSDEPTRPVEEVSWNDIVNDFQPGTGLRLPTEAEWEYAYRAGTTTAFHGYAAMPNGFNEDSLVGNIGWFYDWVTHPVGQKAANGFGLYDMAGNVEEWCADRYGQDYYSSQPANDPVGPSSALLHPLRVLRGGSWNYNSAYLRASSRQDISPDLVSNIYGFRVARTP